MQSAPTESKPPITLRQRLRWLALRAVLLVGGTYLGILALLLILENALLFPATSARDHWVQPPHARIRDVEFTAADGTRIHAWWHPHERSQDVLLYCHGNAGNLSHRGSAVVRWQQEMDASVLIFDYPGYGRSGGSPTEAGCYAAADAAYQWLTEDQPEFAKPAVPPERILIYGKSLGGGIAVDLASRKPHRALILAKAFTSVPEAAQSVYFWLPARWLVSNQFNSLAKLPLCRQPVFIAHGTRDELVPYSHAERLFATANEPKMLLRMPDVDHNGPFSDGFYRELRGFLQKAEARPAAESPSASGSN